MKKIIFILSILLFLYIAYLFSYELSYGILDDCPYINKRLRSFNILYLKEEIPDNLPIDFPMGKGFLFGEIPIQNERLIVARNSSSGNDELYFYNGFNDSIQYIQAEGITSIINNVLVELYIPLLAKDKNSKSSIMKLFGLTSDKMLCGSADFRNGLVQLHNKEYFIGLVNNTFDYSDLEKTTLYLDINNDGYISEKDSLDMHGNFTKEVFHAEDSFTIDSKSFLIDSISTNGYYVDISELNLKEKYAVGYIMPEFKYFNSTTDMYETYENSDKITVIFVWSSGCSASRMCFPIINALYEKYKDNEGFKFLSFTSDNLDDLEQHKQELDIQFPFYANNSQLDEVFGKSVPRTVVIDSDGIIKAIFEGYFIAKEIPENIEYNENYKKIDEYLTELLN